VCFEDLLEERKRGNKTNSIPTMADLRAKAARQKLEMLKDTPRLWAETVEQVQRKQRTEKMRAELAEIKQKLGL
jgi:flagellar biosynthesis regulator FlaF